jgi:hypothetical protein
VKYISFYWSLLLSWSSSPTITICPSRASDLLTAVLASSNKFQCPASVHWLETSSVLAYISLVRLVFTHTRSTTREMDSESQSRLVSDLMREYFLSLETIFTNKRQLFQRDLRARCLSLLFELFHFLHPTQSLSQDGTMELDAVPLERDTAVLFEWCSSQGWGISAQVRRGRPPTSRGPRSSSQSEGDSPQPLTPVMENISLSLSDPTAQQPSRKRGRSGGDTVSTPSSPVCDLDELGKKRRAISRVRQLLLGRTTDIVSPSQPRKSMETSPSQNTQEGQQASSMLPARSTSTLRSLPACIPKIPPPPLPTNILRPPLPSSLLRPPLPTSLLRPPLPTSLLRPPARPSPPPLSSSSAVSSPVARPKEKKRKAILKLREIFHHDRVGWHASVARESGS